MEQNTDVSAAPMRPAPVVPALQLVDRAGLHASLKPAMSKASFTNWLQRAMTTLGFPEPIRTGARSCSWSVQEVQAWLASRPRKGAFLGTRRGEAA